MFRLLGYNLAMRYKLQIMLPDIPWRGDCKRTIDFRRPLKVGSILRPCSTHWYGGVADILGCVRVLEIKKEHEWDLPDWPQLVVAELVSIPDGLLDPKYRADVENQLVNRHWMVGTWPTEPSPHSQSPDPASIAPHDQGE